MNEVDLRLLRAALTVAEELHFSRASARLHISQPALTKQIQDLEGFLRTPLFHRGQQGVTLTDAGRAFVQEAKLAVFHQQRAIQVARSAASGAEAVLNVGQSPYTNPILISVVTSVHLPLFPDLHLHVFSDYSPELARRLAIGELDVAVMAAGNESREIAAIELAVAPLYLLLEQSSPLARRSELRLDDLGNVPWILFSRQVHPVLYEAILDCASEKGVIPAETHHVTSAEHAAQLVHRTGGVAFLTKHGAWRVAVGSLVPRPLIEPGIKIRTVLASRIDAGRLVSEFVRAVVRKVKRLSDSPPGSLPVAV